LDGHDGAGELARGVHVAVADRGQGGQREIQRIGLRTQIGELVGARDRDDVVGEGEECNAADQSGQQIDQRGFLGIGNVVGDT